VGKALKRERLENSRAINVQIPKENQHLKGKIQKFDKMIAGVIPSMEIC
jgi:hypothetical protein